jgi:hypothetical protein
MSISLGVVTLYAEASAQLELEGMFIVLDCSNIGRRHPEIVLRLSGQNTTSEKSQRAACFTQTGHVAPHKTCHE